MQAIELNTIITYNHEIYLKLPDNVTATSAKVIILYENSSQDNTQQWTKKWNSFFISTSVFDDDFLAERDNAIPQEREFY